MQSGRFTVDTVEIPAKFVTLLSHYQRFEAVSVEELPYWLPGEIDPAAEEYFRCCMNAARMGKIVTRIFVLSAVQIAQTEVLVRVMTKHGRAGIGYAVVPLDELSPHLKARAKELDFAIWDGGEMSTSFRQHDGGYSRRMELTAKTGLFSSTVADRVSLYYELISHAWLVDGVFEHSQAERLSEIRVQLDQNNRHAELRAGGRFTAEGSFFIRVGNETGVRDKVEKLRSLLAEVQQFTCMEGESGCYPSDKADLRIG